MTRYAAVFEKSASNWAAFVPDLPGCVSTGATLEETKRNIREVKSANRLLHRPPMSRT